MPATSTDPRTAYRATHSAMRACWLLSAHGCYEIALESEMAEITRKAPAGMLLAAAESKSSYRDEIEMQRDARAARCIFSGSPLRAIRLPG